MTHGPRLYSRHTYTTAQPDAAGRLFLSQRLPFGYRDLGDNRVHVAAQGDTLHTLAYRYFSPHPQAARLWWVIADFQPDPIIDPTVELTPGRRIIVPALATVVTRVFSEARRLETLA